MNRCDVCFPKYVYLAMSHARGRVKRAGSVVRLAIRGKQLQKAEIKMFSLFWVEGKREKKYREKNEDDQRE